MKPVFLLRLVLDGVAAALLLLRQLKLRTAVFSLAMFDCRNSKKHWLQLALPLNFMEAPSTVLVKLL